MDKRRSPEIERSRGFVAFGYRPHPSTVKTSPGVWRIVWIITIITVMLIVGLCIYFAYFGELHIPPFL